MTSFIITWGFDYMGDWGGVDTVGDLIHFSKRKQTTGTVSAISYGMTVTVRLSEHYSIT